MTHRVKLGGTGLWIHPLVLGTLPMGPLQAGLSPQEGGTLIRYALERGVTLVDTAELYGTYPHIRAALAGFSGQVSVATKTHAATASEARLHVEKALTCLGMDHLDIVHLHAARLEDPFVERGTVLDELRALKHRGLVRFLGISTHRVAVVRAASLREDIDVVHPLINRTGMGILDGTAQQMAEAIAQASAAGKGVYAMKALAGGNLVCDARACLRWAMGVPGLHAVAVGMLSLAQVDATIALFEGRDAPHLWEKLQQTPRRLVIMEILCKGCGSCVECCPAGALAVEGGKARVQTAACVRCGYCASSCPQFAIRFV